VRHLGAGRSDLWPLSAESRSTEGDECVARRHITIKEVLMRDLRRVALPMFGTLLFWLATSAPALAQTHC
jgi:hypothetical protein